MTCRHRHDLPALRRAQPGHLCPGCSSDIDELTADDPFYVEPKPPKFIPKGDKPK
jgi:hypothetical protein